MKKITTIALAAVVSGAIFSNSPVLAQIDTPIKISQQNIVEEDMSNFIKASGVIKEVKKEGTETSIIVENPVNSLQTIFRLTNDVMLFNSGTAETFKVDDLTTGVEVEAYYDKNKPMIMIYPAVITPEILIVNDSENRGTVKVGKFDENLVSLDRELKLNIGDETILLNEEGDSIEKKDLHGKELLVFYTMSTKSIPAQTTPSKVIALNELIDKKDQVFTIVNKDYYMNNDIKMIPLRTVAELAGFEVEWQQVTSSVLLQKPNQSFVITINNKQFIDNGVGAEFETAPQLTNQKVYVQESLLERLLGDEK